MHSDISPLHEQSSEQQKQEADLHEKIKQLEKEVAKAALEQGAGEIDGLIANAEPWKDSRIAVARMEVADSDQLKSLGDNLREKLKSGIGLLASVIEGKVLLVCVVTDDLVKSGVKAGAIVGPLAKKLGGGGGGKPHMATAGAKDTEGLDAVLAEAPALIREIAEG